MGTIKKFNEFNNEKIDESNNILTESVKLTDDEKKYLWSKIEYTKKKRAINTENKLFKMLNGNKKIFSDEDFNLILKSLEYTFRKKLMGFDRPINKKIFKKLVDKIPEDWIGLKYSSLSAREKRKNRKPTPSSSKEEIINYLKLNGIKFDENKTKKELLELIK